MQGMRTSRTGPRTEGSFILVLGCGGLISAADNWIVAPILPSIADSLGISVAQAALILTAYMIPYGLMQPVHGHISEGYGRLRLLRGLMLGLVCGTLGCALSPSFLWLCLCRCVTGFFAAGLIAVSLALIGDRTPVTERQKHVGRFMGIVFLGQAVSVGFGGLLAQYVSWRIVFAIFAVVALLVYGLFLRLSDDLPRKPAPNFAEELVRAIATRKGRTVYLLAFATGTLLLGIYGFIGAYLQQLGGLTPLQAGGVLMLFGFASLTAGSSMGRITRKMGRKGTALIGAVLGGLAAGLLASSSHWGIDAIAVVALGFGYVFVQSTLATLAFEVGSSGLSSGLVGLGLFGGGGIASAAGGFILAYDGYDALWHAFVIGTVLLIAVILKGRDAFSAPC